MTATLLLLSAAMLLLAMPGLHRFREGERRRKADRDYRAASLLLWAKQYAARKRRQGVEA